MKIKILALSLIATLSLSACVNLDKKIYGNYDKLKKNQASHIQRNITNFSNGLMCMDKLLMNRRVRYISLLIESLNDNTDQVKAGTRDMLISAISDMSKRSKKIKIIVYGKDSANLISFLKTAQQNDAYRQIPQYDIRGSISQYDKDIVQADNSLGLFVRGKAGGGLGKSKAASLDIMTLDLSAVNTRDMSVVPSVTSKNTIAIYNHGNSLDADARINKLGIYFDMTLSRSEGKSQALRNLIELAAIEIIGKLTKVPYWTCLGAKSPDELLKGDPIKPPTKEKAPKQKTLTTKKTSTPIKSKAPNKKVKKQEIKADDALEFSTDT